MLSSQRKVLSSPKKKTNKQNQRNKQHDESHRTLTMKLYFICMYDAYIHNILCMNQCYRAFHTHTKFFASIQREIVCYVLEVADGREIYDRIMTRGKRLKKHVTIYGKNANKYCDLRICFAVNSKLLF